MAVREKRRVREMPTGMVRLLDCWSWRALPPRHIQLPITWLSIHEQNAEALEARQEPACRASTLRESVSVPDALEGPGGDEAGSKAAAMDVHKPVILITGQL